MHEFTGELFSICKLIFWDACSKVTLFLPPPPPQNQTWKKRKIHKWIFAKQGENITCETWKFTGESKFRNLFSTHWEWVNRKIHRWALSKQGNDFTWKLTADFFSEKVHRKIYRCNFPSKGMSSQGNLPTNFIQPRRLIRMKTYHFFFSPWSKFWNLFSKMTFFAWHQNSRFSTCFSKI